MTRSTLTKGLTASVAALALSLGLAACSGSSSSSAKTSEPAAAPTATTSDAETPSAPAVPSEAAPSAAPSAPAAPAAGPKPSKEQFRAGWNTILEKEGWHDKAKAAGLSETAWNNYVNCAVDRTYTTFSEPLIEIVAEGRDVSSASPADMKAMKEAATTCASETLGK